MKKGMGEKGKFRALSKRAGKVVLVEPSLTKCRVALVEHDQRVGVRDRIYMEMTRQMLGREAKRSTVRYIKTIVQVIRRNRKAKEIMLLHRNNETNLEGMSLVGLRRGLKWGLLKLGVMSEEEFESKMQVMTMHKSKGLEAEVVIILEADEGVIPKTHPDTILYMVFGETQEVSLADQKRLFYVAMTRAKKRLYIIHDSGGGEGFIKYLGRGIET
jgi:superfamily I DNA/RNA helicase